MLRRLVYLCALQVMHQHATPVGRLLLLFGTAAAVFAAVFFVSAPFAAYFVRKQSHTHVERFEGRVKGLRAFEEGCGTSTGPKFVSRGLVF